MAEESVWSDRAGCTSKQRQAQPSTDTREEGGRQPAHMYICKVLNRFKYTIMKTSIEIIDDITIKLMQNNRSHAVTTPEHKSYFEGRMAALKELRDELLRDCEQHHSQIANIIAKM